MSWADRCSRDADAISSGRPTGSSWRSSGRASIATSSRRPRKRTLGGAPASSLVARSARELRKQGYLTAVVDLGQTVGRDGDSEAGRWYYGIAYRIVRDLRLAVDLQHWWQEKKPLSPLQRLNEFFWEIVLANTPR